jgi:hypothetical protein
VKRRLFALFALAPALIAQSPSAPPQAPAPPFDTAQYVRFSKKGTGRIDGQFVLKLGTADVKPQSGVSVECFPDLPYTEWSLTSTANAINQSSDTSQSGTPSADDPALAQYTRTTKTDPNGNFHFYRLPYGRYIMRASLITPFARTAHNMIQEQISQVYSQPEALGTGFTVYDYTHAYFDSKPVYVGAHPPLPPIFHLVARHNTFDPRR